MRRNTLYGLASRTRQPRSLRSNASATNLLALKSSRKVSSSVAQDLGHPPITRSSLISSAVLGDLAVAKARASSVLLATPTSLLWRCSLLPFRLPLRTWLLTSGLPLLLSVLL